MLPVGWVGNVDPTIKIEISKDLYEKIRSGIYEQGFDSVDEYVEFVLSELVAENDSVNTEAGFVTDEEKIIKDRFKSLGYLE
jgi:hypothetical protein